MKIFQMSDALANKIAAGEVVERPASVVKELVENSIDANSTWVKIEVEEAGLQKIKVTDNGVGMSETDCGKSFLPHATSKIKNETDLFHVKTLGFRGEALASIAAVSRLKIKTSEGDQSGTCIELEGGKIINQSKSDARMGTEILVEDLFFNTPARLKYMKTIHTELGHITDLMNRLALSHPNVRFELTHNGRQLFKTAGTDDLLQVISQVYGMNVAKKMVPVEEKTLDFHINGYIAKPEITRSSRNYISTIINGRFIKSIPLSQAITRGYHTLLPIGRMPIVVLSITMDPILVDVNVHPTKLEVRFSKEKELFQLIEKMIRQTFRQTSLIPEMEQAEPKKQQSFQPSIAFDEPKQVRPEFNSQPIGNQEQRYEPEQKTNERTGFQINESEFIPSDKEVIDTTNQPTRKQERVPIMYPIGQLHGTYLLAQNENGLYMIDQHAAQERVKYEFFRDKLGQSGNTLQELLLPMTFEFSKQESIFIDQYEEEFKKVGLFFEEFGNQTYIIRSHPTWFPAGYEEEVIREMIDQIMHDAKVTIETIREEAAIMMSCKGSIKANHYLNEKDMFHLLEDLRKTTDPFTCPHGRPIIVHFSSYELEKMFKRVM
ncbi:DNA mismatch repair endonuclease MutL [Virgibacillus necropolis]|uniref:DNA mismatch repair protein MutL n=1 Tax=Virgibacillus necropolis TaxID=163877 RepID=A0A221MDK3_9BACI|nr:DNA mismatch repair endonuclease MutL [Virgibacillus necropolis]ASN05659.1 DNA mismatch repair protein MutL [Virgibacillus necropolis]